MQKEHQKTLSGLHEEIAQLTKKYSGMHEFSFQMYRFYLDMQFLMAMQADTSNLAEQQKDIIKRLQSDCDCLQSQLSQSEQRESEMVSQLSWERVQHDNLVACLKRQLEDKEQLGEKLSQEDKEKILEVVEEKIEWLRDNEEASADQFKEVKKEIEEVAQPIIAALYQNGNSHEDSGSNDEL